MSSDEIEVRFTDQEMINDFGRLNNRLIELRLDMKQYKIDIEKLDDASADLMMEAGGKVMLLVGECFIETTDDAANEYCERKQEGLAKRIASMAEEEKEIIIKQDKLKKELYGRFGDSINLES